MTGRHVLTCVHVVTAALGYPAPDGRRFPGVQGAIARRAEAVWQGLDKVERRAARRVFLGLVIPGPEDERGERLAEDTGRRAWRAEWDEPARRVVEKLDELSGPPTAYIRANVERQEQERAARERRQRRLTLAPDFSLSRRTSTPARSTLRVARVTPIPLLFLSPA